MKASELIKHLTDIISEYGDVEVGTNNIDNFLDLYKTDENRIPFRPVFGIVSTPPEYLLGDHFYVFRKYDAPKESTGYANYDGREF